MGALYNLVCAEMETAEGAYLELLIEMAKRLDWLLEQEAQS